MAILIVNGFNAPKVSKQINLYLMTFGNHLKPFCLDTSWQNVDTGVKGAKQALVQQTSIKYFSALNVSILETVTHLIKENLNKTGF